MTRYVIIGAGAVGAGMAARLHDVGLQYVLVARGQNLDAIRRNGLRLQGPGEARTIPLAVVGRPEEVSLVDGDVLVFTTKTQDLEEASRQWAVQPVTFADREAVASELPVITLQNGLEADRIVQRRYGRVIGGSIRISARHLHPGTVETGTADPAGTLTLGVVTGGDADLPERVAEDLRLAGYRVRVSDDTEAWQRAKLLNSVRNALDVFSGDPSEIIRVSDQLVAEAREVLAANGLPTAVPDQPPVPPKYAQGHRSVWQSITRGVSTEVDYLNGEISLLGRLSGVRTPYNTAVQRLLALAEVRHGTPGGHDIQELVQLAQRSAEWSEPAPRAAPAVKRWHESAGVRPRGTLLVLTGRGESTDVYQRFGRRLSADSYRVIAIESDPAGATGTTVSAQVADLLADPDIVRPVVLVGSDTGAVHASRLAQASADRVDALVLAALPVDGTQAPPDAASEIAARTTCSIHRKVLGSVARTGLFTRPVASFVELRPTTLPRELPTIAIHGEEDAISPLAQAAIRYAELGVTELTVVLGGRHDILNDSSHRSVAATVVLFLERLRLGTDLPPLVEVHPLTTARPSAASEPSTPDATTVARQPV